MLIGILKNIEIWFLKYKRSLPWRENPTIYKVWVSEIMLQQTQVKKVIPYFNKFIARFPSLKDLALAKEEEVLFYWAGLGYYRRAKNLLAGAKKVYELQAYPKNKKEWLLIPGVGEYTAGAILSLAQNQPEAILDANVRRVLSRVRGHSNNKRLWKTSALLVKKAYKIGIPSRNFNEALIELGALVCTPKNPFCDSCPFSTLCKAFLKYHPHDFPKKTKKPAIKKITEKAFILLNNQRANNQRVFLKQKKEDKWHNGLWDFPLSLEISLSPLGFQKITAFDLKYSVTHHRILRTYEVWQKKDLLNQKLEGEWVFLNPKKLHLPLTSNALKALKKVHAIFKDKENKF